MEIHQGSDIHLEFGRDTLQVPEGEILILNGDIVVAHSIFMYLHAERQMVRYKFKKHYRRAEKFFKECSQRYKKVIYVLGNHEHYKFRFHKTAPFLKQWFKELGLDNIHLLDNESIIIDNVKFFGATLWTDMRKSDPMVMWDVKRGMNDCSLIQYYDDTSVVGEVFGDGFPKWMSPQDMVREHEYSVRRLKQELSTDHRTIVVTHHGPTYESIPKEYRADILSFAYCSDLSDLILDSDNILMWFHGHTHTPTRYLVDGVPVICNPRGYFNSGNNAKVRKWEFTKLKLDLT